MSSILDVKTGREVKAAYIKLCDACITSILIGNSAEVVKIVDEYKEARLMSGDLLHYTKFMSTGQGYINLVNKVIDKRVDKDEAIKPFKDMIDIAEGSFDESDGSFYATNVDEEELAAILHNAMEDAVETLGDDATADDIGKFVDAEITKQRDMLNRMGVGIDPGLDTKKPDLPSKNDDKYKEIFKTIAYGAAAVIAVGGALFLGAKAISAIREIGSGDIIINE